MDYQHHITMHGRPSGKASPMQLAVIDENVLTGIGLQHLLEDLLPMADITVCHDFREEETEFLEACAHYFVASRIYFEHPQFFRNSPKKTIVLVGGDVSIAGVRTLNICQNEKALVRDILTLRSAGHGKLDAAKEDLTLLSAREAEVAVLLCKGYINKEVADRLGISLTTVISHRRNIMSKLRARSLADIIIYAVTSGLVDVGEL